MIRLVLACVIPASVALAAAFLVGPDVLSPSRGEPMLVASQKRMAALHAVSHQGCAPKVLADMAPRPAGEAKPATLRIVKLHDEPERTSVADLPFDGPAGTSLVLVIDQEGRLLAAGDRAVSPDSEAAALPCPEPDAKAEPGII